jgi:hypothetical protein
MKDQPEDDYTVAFRFSLQHESADGEPDGEYSYQFTAWHGCSCMLEETKPNQGNREWDDIDPQVTSFLMCTLFTIIASSQQFAVRSAEPPDSYRYIDLGLIGSEGDNTRLKRLFLTERTCYDDDPR